MTTETTCITCNQSKPVTLMATNRNRYGQRVNRRYCKACDNQKQAERRARVKRDRLAYQASRGEMLDGGAELTCNEPSAEQGKSALTPPAASAGPSSASPGLPVASAGNLPACACPKRTICTHCNGMTEGKASECRFCRCRLKLRVYKSHQAGCARLARLVDGWPAQRGDSITGNHAGAAPNKRHARAS